jgi:hypothetical protein
MLLAGCGSEVATAGQNAGLPDAAAAAKSSGPASEIGDTEAAAGAGVSVVPADPTASAAGSPTPTLMDSNGPFPVDPTASPSVASGGYYSELPGLTPTYVPTLTSPQVAAYLAKDPKDYVCSADLPPVTTGQMVYLTGVIGEGFGGLVVANMQAICGPDLPSGATLIIASPEHAVRLSPETTFDLEGSQPGVMVWATYKQFLEVAAKHQDDGPFGWGGPFFVLKFDPTGIVTEVIATNLS